MDKYQRYQEFKKRATENDALTYWKHSRWVANFFNPRLLKYRQLGFQHVIELPKEWAKTMPLPLWLQKEGNDAKS